MLNINYIYQSGFKVELDHTVLIFDFSRGKIDYLPPNKDIYFFTSSCAEDHFNSKIFHLASKRDNIHYFVCQDKLFHSSFGMKFFFKHTVEKEARNAITFTAPNEHYYFKNISVQTLNSCDENDSVAYLVKIEGKTFFHAGHMNIWSWQGKDEQINLLAKRKFENEVKILNGKHINVAFLVLDPRQENKYAEGFNYFMNNVDVDEVFPCHFKEENKVIDYLLQDEISLPYRKKIKRTYEYF